MPASSFLIALRGEVKFLEVLKFDASFILAVGYEGVGSWRVEQQVRLEHSQNDEGCGGDDSDRHPRTGA